MPLKDLIKKVHGKNKLSALIDIWVKNRETLPDNRAPGWHVSQFAGACPREIVLSELTTKPKEEKTPARILRIWDYGTALHEWYQNEYLGPMGILWGRWKCSRCGVVLWGLMPRDRHQCEPSREKVCKKLCGMNDLGECDQEKTKLRGGCIHCGLWGRWLYREVPVQLVVCLKELTVTIVGSSDGLVFYGGEWRTLEMKSRNDRLFQATMMADPGHDAQAKIYAHLINTDNVRGLPQETECPKPIGTIVMYLGKNDSQEKEYVSGYEESEGSSLLRVPVEVEISRREKVLPSRCEECKTLFSEKAKACKMATYCFGKLTWDQLAAKGQR